MFKEKNPFSQHNVLLVATNAVNTPGGYSGYLLFDISSLGFSRSTFFTIGDGIVQAIHNAYHQFKQVKLKIESGRIFGLSENASPMAYYANSELDRILYSSDVETETTIFQILEDTVEEEELALLTWMPIPSISSRIQSSKESSIFNNLIHGDVSGYSSWIMEHEYNKLISKSQPFIASFSPTFTGDIQRSQACHSKSTQECIEWTGRKVINEVKNILKLSKFSNKSLQSGTKTRILSYLEYFDFSNITIVSPFIKNNSRPIQTCPAVLGLAAGSKNTDVLELLSFMFKIGKEKNPLYEKLFSLKSIPIHVQQCHSPKIPLVPSGLMTSHPWSPTILPLQLIILDSSIIVGIPFHVSTMAGRKIKEWIHYLIHYHYKLHDINHIIISSLSNSYSGHLTTFEEYQTQQFEGAFTHFGPWQLVAVLQKLEELFSNAISSNWNSFHSSSSSIQPSKLNFDALFTFQAGVLFDDKPLFESFGSVATNCETIYSPGQTVIVHFWGAHPKNQLFYSAHALDFCAVEKWNGTEWNQILGDSDWETRFIWRRFSISYSICSCEWDIPLSFDDVGTAFRIKHYGYWKSGWTHNIFSYYGISNTFQIETSLSSSIHPNQIYRNQEELFEISTENPDSFCSL